MEVGDVSGIWAPKGNGEVERTAGISRPSAQPVIRGATKIPDLPVPNKRGNVQKWLIMMGKSNSRILLIPSQGFVECLQKGRGRSNKVMPPGKCSLMSLLSKLTKDLLRAEVIESAGRLVFLISMNDIERAIGGVQEVEEEFPIHECNDVIIGIDEFVPISIPEEESAKNTTRAVR